MYMRHLPTPLALTDEAGVELVLIKLVVCHFSWMFISFPV
jgi:hypothetical protein